MKKIIIVIMILSFAASTAFAQGTKVASAYQYLRDEQPEKAKVEIDAAINYEGTKEEARTWFYRGNTYLQLYLGAHMTDNLKKGLSSAEVKAILGEPLSVRRYKKLPSGEKFSYMYELVVYFANDSLDHFDFPMEKTFKDLDNGKLLDEAYRSYVKAMEIEPDYRKPELSPGSPQQGIKNIGKLYSFYASNVLREDKFQLAIDNFEKAMPIYKELNMDGLTTIYYSAGFAAQQLGDTAKAIKYYQASVSPKMKNRNIYINLANLYLKTGDTEKALSTAQKGLEVIPGDLDLLITQANIYMHNGQSQKANELLSKAAEKDPTNSQLQYAIGVNYDKMAKDTALSAEMRKSSFEASVAAYQRAVEIKPDYFNAAFNLGAMYYNSAADKLSKAGNLPMSAAKEYDALKAAAAEDFKHAIAPLETAHKIDPKDHNTMVMLRTAYMQTKNMEGYKKIKEELSAE
jgi:tetratricopeptide (TPR) repeat protein